MLEPDDYVVLTKANNGYLVSVNNDNNPDDEATGVHVFNDITKLLDHVGGLLRAESEDVPEQLDS